MKNEKVVRQLLDLEKLDRRAFLRGLTLTSAGILVPKVVQVFMPGDGLRTANMGEQFAFDFETGVQGMNVTRIHDSYTFEGTPEQVAAFTKKWTILIGRTLRTQCSAPNYCNIPRPQ
jgi:hypothetical protein